MADVCIVAGFVLMVAGVAVVAGGGWACLMAGGLLFVAGGRESARRRP